LVQFNNSVHAGLQQGTAALVARKTKRCARWRGNYNLPRRSDTRFSAPAISHPEALTMLFLVQDQIEQGALVTHPHPKHEPAAKILKLIRLR
jgi:hypothetical protein